MQALMLIKATCVKKVQAIWKVQWTQAMVVKANCVKKVQANSPGQKNTLKVQ